MDINTITFEVYQIKWEVELLISEIIGTVLGYPVPHRNVNLIFITCNLAFKYHGIYHTNTGSYQITGIYWPHKTTLYDNKSSSRVKCCIKSWVSLTFDPTTCYLVDYNLQNISVSVLKESSCSNAYSNKFHFNFVMHLFVQNKLLKVQFQFAIVSIYIHIHHG